MFRINSTYEKGEFILIFYIPLVAVIMVLTHVIQQHLLFFTYNMLSFMDFMLLALLPVALALVYSGISKVSEERLKTTDWFLCIILFLYLAGSVLVGWAAIITMRMAFDPSPAHDFLRERFGYVGAMWQLLRAVVMGVGAWVWLRGIWRARPVLAITGAILLVVTLLPFPQIAYQTIDRSLDESELVMDGTAANMGLTEETREEAPIPPHDGPIYDETSDSSQRPPLQLGHEKPRHILQALARYPNGARFYPVALLLFTFMRYGKRQRETAERTDNGSGERASATEGIDKMQKKASEMSVYEMVMAGLNDSIAYSRLQEKATARREALDGDGQG